MPATMAQPGPASAANGLPEKMLTDADLASLFGVCLITVRRWLKAGKLPAPIKLGDRRYWHPSAIARFVEPAALPDPGGEV